MLRQRGPWCLKVEIVVMAMAYDLLMRLQGRLWEDRRERVVLGREEASFPQLSNYR
jgi:hypothetical protein